MQKFWAVYRRRRMADLSCFSPLGFVCTSRLIVLFLCTSNIFTDCVQPTCLYHTFLLFFFFFSSTAVPLLGCCYHCGSLLSFIWYIFSLFRRKVTQCFLVVHQQRQTNTISVVAFRPSRCIALLSVCSCVSITPQIVQLKPAKKNLREKKNTPNIVFFIYLFFYWGGFSDILILSYIAKVEHNSLVVANFSSLQIRSSIILRQRRKLNIF